MATIKKVDLPNNHLYRDREQEIFRKDLTPTKAKIARNASRCKKCSIPLRRTNEYNVCTPCLNKEMSRLSAADSTAPLVYQKNEKSRKNKNLLGRALKSLKASKRRVKKEKQESILLMQKRVSRASARESDGLVDIDLSPGAMDF